MCKQGNVVVYYISSTHTAMSRFSGPYSTEGPAKVKAVFVGTIVHDLSPSVLNCSGEQLKAFFYL